VALGRHFDAYARRVTQMLASRPGLRAAGDDAALIADLVAVRAFASADTGDLRPTPDGDDAARAFFACLVGGLLRLPTRLGPVRLIDPELPMFQEHRPGAVATLARVTVGQALAPGASLSASEPATVVVWSTTGRRIDGLGADDAVIFAPGTRLHLLEAGTGAPTLYTADLPLDPDPEALERLRTRLRERLS
jgi:hypothetical protein